MICFFQQFSSINFLVHELHCYFYLFHFFSLPRNMGVPFWRPTVSNVGRHSFYFIFLFVTNITTLSAKTSFKLENLTFTKNVHEFSSMVLGGTEKCGKSRLDCAYKIITEDFLFSRRSFLVLSFVRDFRNDEKEKTYTDL